MTKRENDRIYFGARNRRATIIALMLIALVFLWYLIVTKARLDSYAAYTLQNQLELAATSVDSSINDARRSIGSAAAEVGAGWNEDNFDVVSFVAAIKDRYIFDVLEFVDTKGINLMSGDDRFDASDREYFKNGIKGLTGLWVNYNPKVSDEYLLDFYAPVRSNGRIVGVLVGGIGSKITLEPLTQASYFGYDAIGVLFNEKERAIAASFGVDREVYASDIYDMFRLTDRDKAIFDTHVKAKDGEVFSYEGEKGTGIACVRGVTGYGWGFIIIIPSVTFSSVYSDFANSGIKTIGCMIIIVCLYIIYILGVNKYQYTVKLKEDEDIIKGFSKVWHSVFMLDYTDNTARCLRLSDPAASKFGIKEGEEFPIGEVLMKYLLSQTDSAGAEQLVPIDNLMYINSMMEGKEFIRVNYPLLTGGNGAVDIADMRSEEASVNGEAEGRRPGRESNHERFLMGMMELD